MHDLDGVTPDRGYATSPANETDCVLFDGGRHAAFISDASGRWEIYCDDFPVRRHTVQLTRDGCMPSRPWSNRFWTAGGELFYFSAGGNTIRAMSLRREGDSYVRGDERTLFDLPPEFRGLAPAPDGQRFLVALPAGGYRPPSLTFVDHWDTPPDSR